MAKKKGSMSLKDFHGGEIRSDLPLPSKPGVGTETNIKASFGGDRAFSDPSRDRLVPAYGHGNSRAAPPPDRGYFPDSSTIGKNYEEDERKPVGGGSAKRPENAFSGGAPAYPSHVVTERFPPSGGGFSSRLAELPSTPPPQQNSPPKAEHRPKLTLTPRSKPLEDDSTADVSITPGAQVLTIERNAFKESGDARPKTGGDEGRGGGEGGDEERPKERPKLNLKPRSQEVGAAQEGEQSRPGVFGGARPRDVVLKERGVDEATIVGVVDKRPVDSPKPEPSPARVASPDKQKWGKLGEEPREDRYVRPEAQRYVPEAQRRPGGDLRENGPTRNGWRDGSERPGLQDGGAFRGSPNGKPEGGFERQGNGGGFERQGSGGFARAASFGDNRGGAQWRQAKPASPPIRSALIDASAKKDPWEAPLTSLQLAEAFSRSTSFGSGGQGRGPGASPWGGPNKAPAGEGSLGRRPDRGGGFGRGPANFGGRGGYSSGRGSAGFGGPGRDGYRRAENEYRGPPRSQVYQDDERG